MMNIRFHYGDPADYDEWARLGGEGAESWAYKEFHKSAYFLYLSNTRRSVLTSWPFRYFLKFEKFIPSKVHPGVNAAEHGSDGPVEGDKNFNVHSTWV
jgi:choline dehydrogenase